MANSAIDDARREVEKEYEQFRAQFGLVLEAVQRVSDAGPQDDVYGLLERLEDVVREARTGGALGSGAKGHRRAVERLAEAESQR
jgi:hypothetical protein